MWLTDWSPAAVDLCRLISCSRAGYCTHVAIAVPARSEHAHNLPPYSLSEYFLEMFKLFCTSSSALRHALRCLSTCRHGSAAAAAMSTMPPDQLPRATDHYYRIPERTTTPSSIAQLRAAGKMESALESVLLSDAVLREHLVDRYGLSFHQVQLARDRRSVFILWDANPGMAKGCQQALEKVAFRLRRDLAKKLKSKHTPFIVFKHNHLPPNKAAVVQTMEQVEHGLAAAAAPDSKPTAAAGPAVDADVAAAVARLEAITQPKS